MTLRPAWATRRAEGRDNVEPPQSQGMPGRMRYRKGPMPPMDKQVTGAKTGSLDMSLTACILKKNGIS